MVRMHVKFLVMYSGILNLETDPLVRMISHIIHLMSGEGAFTFDELVDSFTNGTGSITLTENVLEKYIFSIPLRLNNATVGNVTFGLLGLNVSGLDTWGVVSLNPTTNHTLAFHADLSTLNIGASFWVNISENATNIPGTVHEEGILIADVNNNEFDASFQLAILENEFYSLQSTQFLGTIIIWC